VEGHNNRVEKLPITSTQEYRHVVGKVTLICNEGAGDKEQPGMERLLTLLREAGWQAVAQSSKEENWEKVLENPGELVAGGDGTVGKVARRLIGRHIPIAILPTGTANNIANTLGLTDLAIEQWIAGWKTAHRMKCAAGAASGPWGSTIFIEGLGLGLFADTMAHLDANDGKELDHLDDPEEKIRAVQK
jgi:diacylglycerol kinase family enzyme